MAAPTAPYATQDQVAMFQKNLLLGSPSFTKESPIPLATINQYLTWVGATIDMKLGQAGYVLPLTEISGETWPTHQTYYLEMLACIGVSSLIKPTLLPAPGQGGASGAGVFRTLFETELNNIFDGRTTQLRFRADYYLNSPAERRIADPVGPKSDWLEGYVDKTKYMTNPDYIDLIIPIYKGLAEAGYNWDYTYDMFGLGQDV